eukprot:TRINITY_DN8987_c1_g3_i1.p1 TRINITY_DN8987_c1_g3~~TRINITY_DN8987_c1_g3_i1.p1  ORF type:complete len:429 (+),score=65.65 TRINITY_DN8987_c1_g3_i1:61-1287(+)
MATPYGSARQTPPAAAPAAAPPGRGEGSPRTRRRRRHASASADEGRTRHRRRRREDDEGSRSHGRRRRRDPPPAPQPPQSAPQIWNTDAHRRSATAVAHHPSTSLGTFDPHDRAPEDRLGIRSRTSEDVFFHPGSCVVRGTLYVDGLNYSCYEGHMKVCPDHCDSFLDGLREDLICEVGNGLRKCDILFRVYPGAVRNLVLDYDKRVPPPNDTGLWWQEDPKLLDADWGMRVDYAIRARNPQRQQGVATALYHVLGSAAGLPSRRTKQEYIKWLDPDNRANRNIVITRSVDGEAGGGGGSPIPSRPLWTPPALTTNPATRVVSPVRKAATPATRPQLHVRQQVSTPAAREWSQERGAAPVSVALTSVDGVVADARGTVFEATELDGRRGVSVFIPEEAFAPAAPERRH